ncbi:MAG: MFS transporter [Actinomycetota bacterium]|nr:MFS transporter [Actinomycetota bacterium]
MTAGPAGQLRTALSLLRERRFRLLLQARVLTQTADGLYQITLASVLIFNVTAAETPAQVTRIFAVTLLPFSLVGPFTGPFIDRFSRRSILVGANLFRAAVTVGLLIGFRGPEWLLLGLTVLNMSASRFFHATKDAVLPLLVRPADYLVANATHTIAGRVFGLAGAIAGAPLVEFVSPYVPMALAVALMLGAAASAGMLALPRGERKGLAGIVSELRDNLKDVRAGLRQLRRRPMASYALASIVMKRALLGFVLLASLVVLRTRFDVGPTGYSAILGAVAVGSFAGAMLVPRVARRVGHPTIAPAALALAGLAVIVGAPIPAWPVLLGTVFLAGATEAATKITADTMIQRAMPDHFRGRAFAVADIGYNGAFVLSGLLPTLLRPVLGDLGVIVLTGALYLGASWLLLGWRRRLPVVLEVRAYAGGRAEEVPRELLWNGVPIAVEEVERTWEEDREGRRLRAFRLRLATGRRVQISVDDEEWRLDREL